jgi:hypothetical protein
MLDTMELPKEWRIIEGMRRFGGAQNRDAGDRIASSSKRVRRFH